MRSVTVVFVRRAIAATLGLTALGAGIWLLVAEQARTTACNGSAELVSGVTASCQSAAWVYFAGFVVIAFGLVLLGFATFVRRHESRYRRPREHVSDYTLQLNRVEVRRPGQ